MKSLTLWLLFGYEPLRAPQTSFPGSSLSRTMGTRSDKSKIRVAGISECFTVVSGGEGGGIGKFQTASYTNQGQKPASKGTQRQKSHNQRPVSVVSTAG